MYIFIYTYIYICITYYISSYTHILNIKIRISIDTKTRIGSNVCVLEIYLHTGCPKSVSTYMFHPLFERRTSVNERMCMLFRLDHTCTRISISEIRGMSFFLIATYLRHFAYYITDYFIFFVFLLVSLKYISVGTISRSFTI